MTFEELCYSIEINSNLSPQNKEFRSQELNIKKCLIERAIEFEGSLDLSNLTYTSVWTNGEYEVCFGKYGKEYYRVDSLKKNKNDMLVCVRHNGVVLDIDPTFKPVFGFFERLKNYNKTENLIILGCLFIRNAFLLDHEHDGDIKYIIPQSALNFLLQEIECIPPLPIDVWLMYLDALAWQEDVKYKTLNDNKILYNKTAIKKKAPYPTDTGRKNNMLVYASFIACLLGRASWADFTTSQGLGALPKDIVINAFHELKASYNKCNSFSNSHK